MEINRISDIAYQNNSIVSKNILKNESGNITLFAFDAEQELSEHTAPYEAVFYAIEGEFYISIGGQKFEITTNDLIIFPANVPHAVKALTSAKCLLTMLKTKN